MRVGNNPNKRAEAPMQTPKEIATVITHLPNQRGYHAERLEIVKTCLLTMRDNIPVLVWDNGSCPELREWIREDYRPDYLIETDNLGKKTARAAIVGMFPADTVIGFTDDDMLFKPGWWRACTSLLHGFPNVACVSAWVNRPAMKWGNEATVDWATENAKIMYGRFIPDEWERDYADSVGLDYAAHMKTNATVQDILIKYNGYTAYASAQHCQFVARAGTIAPFCRPSVMAMGGELDFDQEIGRAGLLRLSTFERYARHMGNMIDASIERELERVGL